MAQPYRTLSEAHFERGVRAFPVHGKRPCITNYNRSLPGRTTITRWAAKFDGANLGLLTGRSNLVVIDVDDPSLVDFILSIAGPTRANVPRRIEISDEQIRGALERFGGIEGFAARQLGMSPRTMARRIAENPRLTDTLLDLRQRISDDALGVMIARVRAGDIKACFWWLDRFGAERGFGRRRARCEVVSPDEVAQRLKVFAEFCPELFGDPDQSHFRCEA